MAIVVMPGPRRQASIVWDSASLTAEELERGIEVVELPAYDPPVGQYGVLMADKQADPQVWYEYRDIPPDPLEERVEEQEKGQARLSRDVVSTTLAARFLVQEKIKASEITDDELADLIGLYPDYAVGAEYKAGDLLVYEGRLYEVLQDHTSQADWPPDTTASLYTARTPAGVIAEWVQPAGAHDAYPLGATVTWQGQTWVSVIDANVWEPGVYGWEVTD